MLTEPRDLALHQSLLVGPGLVGVLRKLAVGIYNEKIIAPQSHALSILVGTAKEELHTVARIGFLYL